MVWQKCQLIEFAQIEMTRRSAGGGFSDGGLRGIARTGGIDLPPAGMRAQSNVNVPLVILTLVFSSLPVLGGEGSSGFLVFDCRNRSATAPFDGSLAGFA